MINPKVAQMHMCPPLVKEKIKVTFDLQSEPTTDCLLRAVHGWFDSWSRKCLEE